MIESPEDRHLFGLRRPDRKIGTFDALDSRGVRPEFVIEMKVGAFIEEVQVVSREPTGARSGDLVGLRWRVETMIGAMIQ